jgi:hypothetical protein
MVLVLLLGVTKQRSFNPFEMGAPSRFVKHVEKQAIRLNTPFFPRQCVEVVVDADRRAIWQLPFKTPHMLRDRSCRDVSLKILTCQRIGLFETLDAFMCKNGKGLFSRQHQLKFAVCMDQIRIRFVAGHRRLAFEVPQSYPERDDHVQRPIETHGSCLARADDQAHAAPPEHSVMMRHL